MLTEDENVERERRCREPEMGTPDEETTDRQDENDRKYATFFLGSHYLGVKVENVQEVFTAKEMTTVPLASPMIAGLINLRGHIIMTIDLRRRLGFDDRPPEDEVMSIVVRTSDGPVNLLVDRIGDVIEVRSDLFEAAPATLEPRLKETIDGIYKLETGLLLALNTELASEVI